MLYRHAQLMLKQIEQAQIDIQQSATSIAGRVSIGLATYSSSSALSLAAPEGDEGPASADRRPHQRQLRPRPQRAHHDRQDGHGAHLRGRTNKGVTLRPLFREEISRLAAGAGACGDPGEASAHLSPRASLLLPSKGHFLRRLIDESLARARVTPKSSRNRVRSCPRRGGARTGSARRSCPPRWLPAPRASSGPQCGRLVRPVIEATVSLCVSDHLPLSEPALAARAVLLAIVERLMSDHPHGMRPPPVDASGTP